MKGSIPRQFIDDLLTKSNIVDVINARVKLKNGTRLSSLLSVSSRKTPSFTVSEKTILLLLWLWRERQCDFILMDYDKLEFVEAV